MKIGIIGHGVVGGALASWFASQGVETSSYDPPKRMTSRTAIDSSDVVFVCVPTPYAPEAGFDRHYLDDAIGALSGQKLVVIKSTVAPGTTDGLQAHHPQHRFIFNPEFLREAHAIADMMHPDRQVVGVTEESRDDAAAILAMLPAAPLVKVCHAREAEMAKYAANSFLALKVSFANEVFDLCERIGIAFDDVREIVGADPRIGASHFDVLADGYRGYGGKCLPKDTRALLDFAERAGVAMDVLGAADAVNGRLRPRTPTRVQYVDTVAEDVLPQRKAA